MNRVTRLWRQLTRRNPVFVERVIFATPVTMNNKDTLRLTSDENGFVESAILDRADGTSEDIPFIRDVREEK